MRFLVSSYEPRAGYAKEFAKGVAALFEDELWGSVVEADDEEEAVLKYVEEEDHADGHPHGETYYVLDEAGVFTLFEVNTDYDPCYSASQFKYDHPKPCKHYDFWMSDDGTCKECGRSFPERAKRPA